MKSLSITLNLVLPALLAFALSQSAFAGSFTFKSGPPNAGAGGSNPAAVPPVNPIDWEFTWVTKNGFETNVSVFPGILLGHRFSEDNFYLSTGGGSLISLNGIGFGAYTAYGYVTGKKRDGWHFNIEYKQTAGYAPGKGFISPGALRFGIIWQ